MLTLHDWSEGHISAEKVQVNLFAFVGYIVVYLNVEQESPGVRKITVFHPLGAVTCFLSILFVLRYLVVDQRTRQKRHPGIVFNSSGQMSTHCK